MFLREDKDLYRLEVRRRGKSMACSFFLKEGNSIEDVMNALPNTERKILKVKRPGEMGIPPDMYRIVIRKVEGKKLLSVVSKTYINERTWVDIEDIFEELIFILLVHIIELKRAQYHLFVRMKKGRESDTKMVTLYAEESFDELLKEMNVFFLMFEDFVKKKKIIFMDKKIEKKTHEWRLIKRRFDKMTYSRGSSITADGYSSEEVVENILKFVRLKNEKRN